ncbi:hypothetical protein [Garciella nitratireducens]|uniref:hypothetical protein n=1 Tax=Garciella nitratireducens TaxID=218205 RepID=UPI000DE8C02A|nr:hypothetical protein [Garciella nitratireducens]RBP35928.1 hypothetical protein DFR81_13511 [Garciella nitratireducens]
MLNIENIIKEKLQQATLEEILDRKDIHSLDWFWVNRDIFEDILKNIPKFDYYEQEEEIKKYLNSIKDEEFIDFLRYEIETRGFIEISQNLFAKLDKEYRIMEDIQTWIFIHENYYNKLWIQKYNELEWVLKAMAINTYQRLDYPYDSLEETYQELFENNIRIIEEITDKGKYVLESGKWILNEKEGTLRFYKNGKIFYEWGKGEVESRFEELQLL